MKYLLAFIIIIHGLIHCMGFAKAFGYGRIDALTRAISRPAGFFWLTAAFLFVLTGIFLLLKKDSWWLPASAAIIISQILIALSWHDAKYGTIVNIIILILLILAFRK